MREIDDVHPSSSNPSKRDIGDVGGLESAQPRLGTGLGHGLTHGGFRGSRPDHRFRLVAGEAPWIPAFSCSGPPVVSVELGLCFFGKKLSCDLNGQDWRKK
ncbi:hypothetical protein FH972_013379 [Carpinus fangiana]|uniref:Uncharacterized protein n=1 Tax=Carpinus fangiana TaxID=176857 RepID=A0A5N6R924_9ROSI|nr:hypothetical protein FH972_013379 [Carpinus fangiana]